MKLAASLPVVLATVLAAGQPAAPVPTAGPTLMPPTSSPIRKVISLIEDMKAQVEQEGKDDEAAYDKYACWCQTTKAEKEAAVAAAEEKIAKLEAFLEESAAKEGELKTGIASLEEDIAEDQAAIEKATALRAKEHEEFSAEETDLKECLGALAEAVKVLSKVQLLQKNGASATEVQPLLLQLEHVVRTSSSKMAAFRGVMQQDLWDVLGSLQAEVAPRAAFLPKVRLAAIEEHAPTVDGRELAAYGNQQTDEAIGKAAKPNDLVGAAAGAKSYNSRSGQIFGILSEMRDEMGRDLTAAQKEELSAEIAFQHLRAAKLAEIAAATKQKEAMEAELAALLQSVAEAKRDLEATKVALAADQEFLVNLEKSCTEQDEEYAKRSKVRAEEIVALGETLKILSTDDARDLFGKTISFIQTDSTAVAVAQQHAKASAIRHILKQARKHRDWVLASIAVRAQLDSFAKVKEMMDKMLADLKQQQKAEYAKWESCKSEIDQTEDKMKEANEEKDDLEELKTKLTNTMETLESEIAALKEDTAKMEVNLKAAGEDRKAENQLFQSAVADQRATIQILHKALARLSQFYAKQGAAFAQAHYDPAASVAPPPPKPKEYRKAENASGVMQMLSKIISEAESDEGVLVVSEQHAQKNYATFAADTTASIEANRNSIAEKSEAMAKASAEKSETEEAILGKETELAGLSELLKGMHLDCDFTLKYFDVRQTARQQEMDAIVEAKAILSGADFA